MERAILDEINERIADLQGWKRLDGKYIRWRNPEGKLKSLLPDWAGNMAFAIQLLKEIKSAGIAVGLIHNPLVGAMSVEGWIAYCRSTNSKELAATWKYYHFEHHDEDPEVAISMMYISWKEWVLNHPPEETPESA